MNESAPPGPPSSGRAAAPPTGTASAPSQSAPPAARRRAAPVDGRRPVRTTVSGTMSVPPTRVPTPRTRPPGGPMRFIPTRVHGLMDYLMAAVLITAPWVLGFDTSRAETWVPVVLGLGAAGYSLFTDYEWGLVRVLPMSTHLAIDFASGPLLAASPWLFGFADRVWGPHLVLGLIEIAAALTTQAVPGTARGSAGSPTLGAGRG